MKPYLFIRGNLLIYNTFAIGGGNVISHVSEKECDLTGSVVIDGDVSLQSLICNGGIIAVSGEVQKHSSHAH